MWSKIIDPRISRRWLLRTWVYSIVAMGVGDRRHGRPLAARWGRSAWRRCDHWCV